MANSEELIELKSYLPIDEEQKEEVSKKISELYADLVKVLKKYLDIKEEYHHIIATWIIGTYMHKKFYSYPYLFFNAMKGSGKSRALKLIAALAYKGEVVASLNESVLFRSEPNTTFCIDEFEGVAGKEKQALRELLNASYKKGTIIKRNKKVKRVNPETFKPEETYMIETFEPYRPIAMANIWGMEEVLNDRCIPLVLEKSNNSRIVNKIEIFDLDKDILRIKHNLTEDFFILLQGCCIDMESLLLAWNSYTNENYESPYNEFFVKVKESGISARALELCFPLIITSQLIGEEEYLIQALTDLMREKAEEDFYESKDMRLFDFLSQKEEYFKEFVSINRITSEFRIFLQEDVSSLDWLNTKWIGRALKRLVLIIKKRRLGIGREVVLDIEKAKQKITLFNITTLNNITTHNNTKQQNDTI